jgi:hypothetical protein
MSGAAALVSAALQATVLMNPVAQGSNSQIDAPRTVVVRSAAAWNALWKEHSPGPMPGPDTDFARFMIVGVFLGTRPTAGFSVEITGVRTTGGVTVVEYRERSPAPGDMTAQILTAPFHLVRVPRVEGAVEFRRLQPAVGSR